MTGKFCGELSSVNSNKGREEGLDCKFGRLKERVKPSPQCFFHYS